jgi:hypothetical protein
VALQGSPQHPTLRGILASGLLRCRTGLRTRPLSPRTLATLYNQSLHEDRDQLVGNRLRQ